MSAIRCLSSDELRNFVLGQTDDARSEEILVHLSECPACEDTVASLDDTADSLVASVRQAVESGDVIGASGGEADDPLAAALANVRSQFAPTVETPPLDGSLSRIIERVRDYELVDELGSGGMGTVYKAVHTKLDRTVALKLLPARRLRDPAAVARFEREMKAIGRLDHPAIVRATDAGEVDGTHFLAMDFVDGIDLGKLVRLTGPLDAASACELIRQAAIGLQYAHEQGLIHRDVKPSNLMVERKTVTRKSDIKDADGADHSALPIPNSALASTAVRILDLGLALFGSASEAVDELTTVGQLMGTLDYMAPEQADNSHSVDARADVYSLGATLFKLLAGMAPYESIERTSPLQKMKALATTDPPPIASRCDGLPDGLAAIVDRMLLRDPDERFQSAAEVADALTPFCNGAAIGDLVERGVRLAELQREARERQLQSSHLAPRDEPLGDSAPNNLSPTRADSASAKGRRSGDVQPAKQNGSSRGARWLLWTALTFVALLAGITIWIETDTGTLKIECADENVPIEIRNNSGKVVKNETLNVGQNEIVIHSGSYEIVLPNDYDELKVENGKYELTRGGEWIARVTKQQSGSTLRVESPGTDTDSPGIAAGDSAMGRRADATESSSRMNRDAESSLVFSGQTFEQWQQSVLTERNPEELKNAVMALCILGRQNRDREAAETVLKVTDAYPCEVGSSPEGELVAAAIRYLRTLNAEAILPAIIEALKDHGTNTRRLIVEHLAAGVMYGGGGFGGTVGNAVAVPNTGKAEPLMSRLMKSPDYRKTLVELFPKFGHNNPETGTLRLIAFQQIETFLDDVSLKIEIDSLLEHIYRNAETTAHPANLGSYVTRAILHLSRRSPRPELATYYLDNLERTYPNLQDDVSVAWLSSYQSDWYGLWLLGDEAEIATDRIAKLLTAKLPQTFNPSPVQTTTLPTTVAGWGDTNSPRQSVTRKVLALDLLATIGPGAKSAVPAVIDEIEALTGQRPVDDGEYGYEANDPRTLFVQFAAPFSHGLTGNPSASTGFGGVMPATGGGFFNVSDEGAEPNQRVPAVMPEPWLRLNAALRALKALTGKTPRFAMLPLSVKQPAAADTPSMMGAGLPGAGYAGGGSEEMYSGGYVMAGGGPVDPAWQPRLVSYRGRLFEEWAEQTLAFQSSTKLKEVLSAIGLLGANEQPEAVAAAAARIFETAMSQRGEITDVDRQVIHNSFILCWQSNEGPARERLLQAVFEGTPQRTALVLSEIVAPTVDLPKPPPTIDLRSEPPASPSIEWAAPNGVTSELVFAGAFGSRYQNLVDGWDDHGPELRAAILRVEAQLPALKQVNRTDLLQKLLQAGSPQEKLAAALIVARIDLSKQLDAPSRAENRDKTFAETPALKPSLKQAAIETLVEAIRERRDDVDWVNAVPALLTLQRGKLDDKLAFEFADIVEADSATPEAVQPFSLTIGSPFSGEKADAAGGFGSPLGAAIGALGLPGMELGTPSGGDQDQYSEPGYGPAGASGFGSGDSSEASGYGMDRDELAKPPKAVRRVLSRRILLLELLTLANQNNVELTKRLSEVIRSIRSQQKPYQGAPLSAGHFTSELADVWQNSATFRGTGPATADVESNTFAGVAIRVSIALPVRAADVMPESKQPKVGAAARAEPLSTGAGAPEKPSKGQPQATYQGRTYDEWFDDVRRERSPDELIGGLEALVTLGAGKHDEDITRQILAIVTRLNVVASDGGGNEALLGATERFLNRLQPEAAVPLLTEAVRAANPAIVWYATQRLMPDLSRLKWNAIEAKTTGPVSLTLYRDAEFRDALLSAWPKITAEMRPQFVLAASLFAAETPPDGVLPDTRLLKFLADVAGGEDTATQVPQKGATRSSLKLHACRALARIYPSCPELPKWTLDGIEPFRELTGSEWWYRTSNGWLALVQMGRHAAGQAERLAEWIVDTDEPYRSVVDYAWVITLESGMKDAGGLAIPRRLVMLEVLSSIADAENLSPSGRETLLTIKDDVPEFAAAALDDERSVKRANDEFAPDVEVSALHTLLLPYRGRGTVRMLNFGYHGAEISSLDGARLVVAHRRCQKLIAELLGEAEAPKAPEKQPDQNSESGGAE